MTSLNRSDKSRNELFLDKNRDASLKYQELSSSDNNYWAITHKVENQPGPLENYNLYLQDAGLAEFANRIYGRDVHSDLAAFGEVLGSTETIELGFQANENPPGLFTHDRYGNRVDEVRYHPAYHQLMKLSLKHGLHNPWDSREPDAHLIRAARFYMMAQIEAGHGCPVTMTCAAIPALKNQPDILAEWGSKILSKDYDPRNIPHTEKNSVTIGMAMTEKQGGSDVRQNSTWATPLKSAGQGELYELIGHKFFVSAPMCDAFLTLAYTSNGLSCFLLPRWREDGDKNPIQIQRLKNKMGNVSNASCETELRGAWGWLIGEEGRGIATIMEMVAMTRFDCMVGSCGGMRQAVAQAVHHCSNRFAFGNVLTSQPLMQNVLADLAIEQEAALALTMRIGCALDQQSTSEYQKLLVRIGTAIGKYWICKRTPGHVYEAMECIGGSGVMEDCIMPRLFRESPVNSIWEGSGNVQCLDLLRAVKRNPATLDVFFSEVKKASGGHKLLDIAISRLEKEFTGLTNIEYRARHIVEMMALTLQGALLMQANHSTIAEGFLVSRLAPENSGRVYGNLPEEVDCRSVIERVCIGG